MKNINEHNKANEQKWDVRARTWDKKGFHYFYLRYFQKKVISIANLQKNTNFLDLGCGTGWAVCYAAALLNGWGNFIGIDISEGMIEKAKENASGLKNISFFKASAEELPLENDFFDTIICTNSFHHYWNPIKALAEAYRVLKQKGRVYILDITADDFFTKWIDGRAGKKEKERVKWYSTAEYKSMFSRAGLSYIKSKWIAYPSKVHIAEK
jgi:ubiquinone/menaquinone biosynthesis C-methylase UbiE